MSTPYRITLYIPQEITYIMMNTRNNWHKWYFSSTKCICVLFILLSLTQILNLRQTYQVLHFAAVTYNTYIQISFLQPSMFAQKASSKFCISTCILFTVLVKLLKTFKLLSFDIRFISFNLSKSRHLVLYSEADSLSLS